MKISFTDKKLEVCRQIAAEASQQPLEYAMAMGTKFESFVYYMDEHEERHDLAFMNNAGKKGFPICVIPRGRMRSGTGCSWITSSGTAICTALIVNLTIVKCLAWSNPCAWRLRFEL